MNADAIPRTLSFAGEWSLSAPPVCCAVTRLCERSSSLIPSFVVTEAPGALGNRARDYRSLKPIHLTERSMIKVFVNVAYKWEGDPDQ